MKAINIRVIYSECFKEKNHEVFGYTYIPAEPKKETSLQNQVKPDEVVKLRYQKAKLSNLMKD